MAIRLKALLQINEDIIRLSGITLQINVYAKIWTFSMPNSQSPTQGENDSIKSFILQKIVLDT